MKSILCFTPDLPSVSACLCLLSLLNLVVVPTFGRSGDVSSNSSVASSATWLDLLYGRAVGVARCLRPGQPHDAAAVAAGQSGSQYMVNGGRLSLLFAVQCCSRAPSKPPLACTIHKGEICSLASPHLFRPQPQQRLALTQHCVWLRLLEPLHPSINSPECGIFETIRGTQ